MFRRNFDGRKQGGNCELALSDAGEQTARAISAYAQFAFLM
jgi:hypothetical protein